MKLIVHLSWKLQEYIGRHIYVGFILLSIVCLSPRIAVAQNAEDTDVAFIGIYYQDSIYLRWAPTNIQAYEEALASGFSLGRALYAVDTLLLSQDSFEASLIMLDSTIQLISEQDFENVSISQDLKDAAIELFYNYDYTPPHIDSVNVFSAFEEEEKKQTLVAFASIIADRDWDAATAMGWAFKDGDIVPGRRYAYVLTSLATEEKYFALVSAMDEYQFMEIPKLTAFEADSIVRITFDKTGLDDYYGYYIQVSEDDGQTFTLASDVPVMYDDERAPNLFSLIDSLPDNENEYVYRVAGVTAFGLQGPWSDTIRVQGIPGPIDASPDISLIEAAGTGVDITFSFPEEFEDKIQGFEVIRSIRREGPFLTLSGLLSPSIREYHDSLPLYSNYYFIRAIDENGYPLLSLPQYYEPIDSVAAAVPVGLSGTIDGNSIARLSWNANQDFDIKGYRLYASNAIDQVFVEITPGTILDTFFQTQLGTNVLDSVWYVKIRSVDNNENASELSEAVTITRPDHFPPSPPVLKDLHGYPYGVAMNWIESSSTDVASHLLQRKEEASNAWGTILDITNDYTNPTHSNGWPGEGADPTSFNFIDTTVEARKAYHYRVIAIDEAGNLSSSAILNATGYDDGIRGEIFDLMAIDMPFTVYANTTYTADQDKPGIAVGWNYTDSMSVHHFIIYRSADNWPYKAYNSYLVYEGRQNPAATTDDAVASAVSSGLNTRYVILDKDVRPGTNYRYKVVAKHLDGGFSGMSEVVSVTTSN
jgi:hypothetical protein